MTEAPRALIAVYDKAGVVELASALVELGWELIASEGTARAISAAGLPVVDVAQYSGSPTMLGHRVVTLHPRVHGGILADLHDPGHRADLRANSIDPIGLVIVNLYPFEASPSIETIDIGGPAMLRAAAKNHARVGVVADPSDYPYVLAELRSRGRLSDETRRRLAQKAFTHTAAYDAAIVAWLNCTPGHERAAASTSAARHRLEPTADSTPDDQRSAALTSDSLPEQIMLRLERAEVLRYGENPHQRGARYRRSGVTSFFDAVTQHSGLALSYLNLMDAHAAWQLVNAFDAGAAVIVKHANPCGVAATGSVADAFRLAFECDPRSAFGGVVAVNAVIDHSGADAIIAAAQADVIIAAGYSPGVLDRLAARRANTRLLEAPGIDRQPEVSETAAVGIVHEHSAQQSSQIRSLGGSSSDFLVQDAARFEARAADWRTVTTRVPTEAELADAEFAWRVCAHVSSNAVVLARDGVAWGIGAGQQNRVEAGRIAAAKAAGRAAGGACASDAFYPFADGVAAAADAGVSVIVQPGGSVNDAAVIAAADERNLAMLFTGERQFRH